MFVLLEHATANGIHWDFILEIPGKPLWPTWRLSDNPILPPTTISAIPIADHPPRFRDYEGPLRQGRGSVRRVDRGDSIVHVCENCCMLATLQGHHLHGQYEIIRHGAEAFVFRAIVPPIAPTSLQA